MLEEAERQFENLRSVITSGQMVWTEDTRHSPCLYMGACPGFTVVVGKTGPSMACDGIMTCTSGAFNVIHLTHKMAWFCYAAATTVRN